MTTIPRPPRGRSLVLLAGLVAGAASLGPHPEPRAVAQTAERPNVLIILTDDQRNRDTMSTMPDTRAQFGDGGTQFMKAVATTPVCCPSRASIFSGRYAHNHGVHSNLDHVQLNHAWTMQRYLQDAGYRTAIAGKFLNKFPVTRNPPYWDRWAVTGERYVGAKFNVDGSLQTVPGYSTHFLDSWATSVLNDFESNDADPWLLYVATQAPHSPFTPEPAYSNAPVPPWEGNPAVFESDKSDKPPHVQSSAARLSDARAIRAAQLRTLMSVDEMVADLFRTLDALGEPNTLAFFHGDNGYLWAEHGLLAKGLPYLPSIEIPFYARWPGHVPAGEVSSRLVGNLDILPTVLEATGTNPAVTSPDPPPPPIDGESLLSGEPRNRILTESWERGIWASLRAGGYQYTEWYDDNGALTFREYYDLKADYWELDNLLADGNAANDPDVASLSARLAADRACQGTSGPTACPHGKALALPLLAVGDAFAIEDGAPGGAPFRISLSQPSANPVSVTASTRDQTATAGEDYGATTLTASIPAGELGVTVLVPIFADATDETDETFLLELSNPVGATIADGHDAFGQATIFDDDEPSASPGLSIGDVSVVEGGAGTKTTAKFPVTMSSPSNGSVTVQYATSDGTATAGSDYVATSGALTIPAGSTSGSIRVVVKSDTVPEPIETFSVHLSNPQGATIARGRGVGTIIDDD